MLCWPARRNIILRTYIKDPQSPLPCSAATGGPGCFSGNIIPQNRLSANGVGLLTAFPNPTPNFSLGSANLLTTGTNPEQQQIDSGNLDIVPTQKDYVRFRLIHFYYHEDNPFATSNYGDVPRIYSRPNETGSLDYVHTFHERMSNEFLFTASHDVARLSIDTSTGTYNRARYGINFPYLFPQGKDLPNKIPTIAFDTTTSITTLDGSTYPSHSQGELFDFADTFTRVIGNHLIRVGGLYERSGENDDDQIAFANSTPGQTNNQNGKFDFSSGQYAGIELRHCGCGPGPVSIPILKLALVMKLRTERICMSSSPRIRGRSLSSCTLNMVFAIAAFIRTTAFGTMREPSIQRSILQ